jgi:putative peptidoglycan lipid II flippase
LRRTLNRRIGTTGLPVSLVARLWGAAAVAAGLAYVLSRATPHVRVMSIGVLAVYGALYLAITAAFGIGDTAAILRRVTRS